MKLHHVTMIALRRIVGASAVITAGDGWVGCSTTAGHSFVQRNPDGRWEANNVPRRTYPCCVEATRGAWKRIAPVPAAA